MLDDMAEQMEKDADTDEDVNEEMMCWCKTNDEFLNAAIKDNTEKSAALTSEIESLRAKAEDLNTELANLNTELESNQKELDTAIAIRKKEVNEFTSAESSTIT